LRFRAIGYFILLFSCCILGNLSSYAQKSKTDSLNITRQRALDSTKAAQKEAIENMKLARQHVADSLKEHRKRIADSLAAARAARASNTGGKDHTKVIADSIAAARKHNLDSTKAAQQDAMERMKLTRQHSADSIKANRKRITDSIAARRPAHTNNTTHTNTRSSNTHTTGQHALDSSRAAQKRNLEQMKLSRQHSTDSVKVARKKSTDALASIRKYRSSKRYQDSVKISREKKIESLKLARKKSMDSLKIARKKSTDSLIAGRKKALDKIKAVQKKRADSMTAIHKYKDSKRYKDSVSLSRAVHLDSIRIVRKRTNDSAFAARKKVMDAMKVTRKHYADSVAKVQKKYMDSIKAVRKIRTDSLAKAKAAREKALKALEKKKEDRMKLALSIKIQKKREAWSNEQMLKKKWSFPRKNTQNLFTRDNYYFNAEKRMKEAVDNMQRTKKENYDSLIALYPFDPNRDSSLMMADMDSIIQKTSIGIQIHDPRSKWGDDLYLLLGQAFYYKGDYKNATSAFRYIISMQEQEKLQKEKNKGKSGSSSRNKSKDVPSIVEEEDKQFLDFLKHKTVHNDAILWLSRTFTTQGQIENSESILELVQSDPKFPEDLKGRLALEQAFLELKQKNYTDATRHLAIAKDDGNLPEWIRRRTAYMNGQLLQYQGNYTTSADNFRMVLDMNPKIDMDFYARKNLANSLMMAGIDQESATSSLKKMLNDGKYTPYYEQVYYVLGGLCASTNKTDEAVTYFQKSIRAPKSTKKQKALSFASLGNVYYNLGDYPLAKKSYDSATFLATYAVGDSNINTAIRRSRALTEITGPAYTIHVQDSLLDLCNLTDKEQRAIAKKYINLLLKKKQDSTFRAENATAAVNNMQDVVDVDLSSWYFSNPSQSQQGFSEFKRKWGTRPLTDNWRRIAASNAISNSSNDSTLLAEDSTSTELDENGLPTIESLLSLIPKTEEKKLLVYDRLQRAYVDLGSAYIKQLDEYARALATFDTLDKRFPNHKYKAEEIYNKYTIALKQNKLPKAQEYIAELLEKYPNTQWAALVRPSEDGKELANSGISENIYYQETYDLLLNRQYTEVLQHVKVAREKYTDTKYKGRLRIIEATAYAGQGEYAIADSLIVRYMGSNPPDSLRAWADAVLQLVSKYRPKTGGKNATVADNASTKNTIENNQKVGKDTNPANATVSANATTATNSNTAASQTGEFTYDSHEEHYCVISFYGPESKSASMKAGVIDLNTNRFKQQNLSMISDPSLGTQGMIVVKSFQSVPQARYYMMTVKNTQQIFKDYKNSEYSVFLISASNYLKLVASHDIQKYMDYYITNYK